MLSLASQWGEANRFSPLLQLNALQAAPKQFGGDNDAAQPAGEHRLPIRCGCEIWTRAVGCRVPCVMRRKRVCCS
jgi:hypothetical protein